MIERLELNSGAAVMEIVPEMGAGVAALDVDLGAGPVPVLRRWADPDSGPFGLASNILAPFSNRISGGGFRFDGVFHPVELNLKGEPFPIHGDAFQKGWAVDSHDGSAAHLSLASGEIGPWRYRADVAFTLAPDHQHTRLTLTNAGNKLPFGGGFHPWLPRYPGTRLMFAADGVWLADEMKLPTELLRLDDAPDWSFAQSRTLPQPLIDNAFTGWSGRTVVVQPDLGLELTIEAPAPLTTALVYSPGADAPFFCFEPVSHTVDAMNREGAPGLTVLEPGESLVLEMTVSWRALA